MSMDKETLLRVLSGLRDRPDELIAISVRQAEQLAVQAEQIARLEATVAGLERRLSEWEQRPPGSVAPFRIEEGKRTQNPKRPGRPKGHVGCSRPRPEVTEDIRVALSACPCCGGALEGIEPVEQIIEELPVVRPRVIRLTTYKGRCPSCGPVRSSHPLGVSTAVGAAGVALGPQALSVIARLQYQWHLSKRKSCQLLEQLFGLRVSPGGLVAATHRLAGRLKDDYSALWQKARQSSTLYSDETGWYVGSPGYSLWVFTNEAFTLYRIVKSRNRSELYQTIGTDFGGVLVSDCLSVYDEASRLQHKCYSHHFKAIKQAMAEHPQNGDGFLAQLCLCLKSAMILKDLKDQTDPSSWRDSVEHLRQNTSALLKQPRGQPQEESVRLRLLKQHDHLFTFLDYDQVEATNNQAERQLRPAVIARKLSCGNRTELGAATFEVLASLAATCRQTGQDLAGLILDALAPTTQLRSTR